MDLAKRERSARRNESRDLVVPIIRALNRLPGVRVVRNANLGPVVPWGKRFDPNTRPIIAGLGAGSADVVGVVMCRIPWDPQHCKGCRFDEPDDSVDHSCTKVTRPFALEVKLPADRNAGLSAGALKPDQRRWLAVFQRFGGFAAVVHDVAEAVAAVEACRRGEVGAPMLPPMAYSSSVGRMRAGT